MPLKGVLIGHEEFEGRMPSLRKRALDRPVGTAMCKLYCNRNDLLHGLI